MGARSLKLFGPPEPGAADKSNGSVSLDKAKFKARLLDLVRECLPFEHSARVTLLMSVRLDDRQDALSVDVSEEVTRPDSSASAASAAAASAAAAAAAKAAGSKRKSQAPQRMVPTGEDSFAPAAPRAPAAAASAAAAAGDASSSFNADLLSEDDQQPLNLSSSRQGSPAAPAATFSTPVKPPSAAFRLNNPDMLLPPPPPLAFHFGMGAPAQLLVARQPQQAPLLQEAPTVAAAKSPSASPSAAADLSSTSNAAAAAAAAAVIASPDGQSQSTPQQQQPQQQRRSVAMRSRRPGNRNFPCNQCGQVFQSLAGLSKHTFTMHKVYKCTFCGANFTQRSNLQRHSLKHVGFKPFECRCCRKSYYRKDHLVRHIEVTHPGHDPKLSIDTRLSSAECLQYLERKHESRDYTSLSGVVMSAAAAAAAASETGGALGELPGAGAGDSFGGDETEEQLMMMEDCEEGEEFGEEGEETYGDGEELEVDDEAGMEAEEEIDVGLDDHPQQVQAEAARQS